MDQTYFLAANSGQGFYSLYDGFPGEGCFLHIIKGGPGTGKSGFMRRIREAAQMRGLDTVSVLCSGDPDSLDGLLIPALGQAWVDGTAPHVREPLLFGADADYVNLGQFCRLPLAEKDRDRALALNKAYKARYEAAYGHLSASAALESAEELRDAEVLRAEEERMLALLDPLPDREGPCLREKRFITAITCQGLVRLNDTVDMLCKQKQVFRDDGSVLTRAAAIAAGKTGRVILCPRALKPAQPEAVLLPELSLALLRAPASMPIPRGDQLLSREALSRGMEELRAAKALHDKLEAVYRPYMDFDALTRYTEKTIERLFG